MAGNQLGKTTSGGAEMVYHATGLYPDDWTGYVFNKPIIGWYAGPTNELTRNNPQRMLLGEPGSWGTGMLPARLLVDEPVKGRGLADLVDYMKIRHRNGGISMLYGKSYDQAQRTWQGPTVDVIWFDEEPPPDVYSEGVTRTNKGGDIGEGGRCYVTATPLMGMTDVMRHFWPEPDTPDRALIQMTIEDVDHYTEEQKRMIVASYPEHEREARSKGIPTLGSGRVYPVTQSIIQIAPFSVPDHWVKIIGLDFGIEHPTAAVLCAWDRDTNTFYIIDEYREKDQVVSGHSTAIKGWGDGIPVAWPHDGLHRDPSSGLQLAQLYRNQGLEMLLEHAQHETGGYGREAGVTELLLGMKSQKVKVFSHLQRWFEEFNTYHRKDGQIVRVRDDLLDATRYAWMMRRFARGASQYRLKAETVTYDPFAEDYLQ